jgi:hypothetical protein
MVPIVLPFSLMPDCIGYFKDFLQYGQVIVEFIS